MNPTILTDGKLWAAIVAALGTIAPVCEEPTRTILMQAAMLMGVIASLIARPHRPQGVKTRRTDRREPRAPTDAEEAILPP